MRYNVTSKVMFLSSHNKSGIPKNHTQFCHRICSIFIICSSNGTQFSPYYQNMVNSVHELARILFFTTHFRRKLIQYAKTMNSHTVQVLRVLCIGRDVAFKHGGRETSMPVRRKVICDEIGQNWYFRKDFPHKSLKWYMFDMKIPKFCRSSDFICEFELPCGPYVSTIQEA